METRYKPRGFPQRLGSLRLPLFPQPRRRYYLPAINLGVGPFYSIKVGSFYVVKARGIKKIRLQGSSGGKLEVGGQVTDCRSPSPAEPVPVMRYVFLLGRHRRNAQTE